MPVIRSLNEITLNLIDYYKLSNPDLDTKPGTVARDLFIDAPANQAALLYDELSSSLNYNSIRLSVGTDLDKLAKNFKIIRRQATASTGVALLTFASINSTININKNDIIIANNGFSYAVSNGTSVVPSASNFYRSVATKFRDQLDSIGISDEFAVEVTVIATTAGSSGRIGKFALNKTSIPGVSNVTNINAFNGGTDQENDATFRNRILSTFSGSSVGTALGYLNSTLSIDGVSDAIVIEPGDTLMTRDGTVVETDANGNKTIVSEGSGGKVDVIALGSNLTESIDSFIYKDKSNTNDPSSSKNNVVLGQILGDENKTVSKKRIDNIKSGVLPTQPIESVLQVSGSLSGSNFKEKTTDIYGRVSGNYELIKDTGVYSGSPWGFDKFSWISNNVDFSEDKVKGQNFGQDTTTFSDVISISKVQQNVNISNENSKVTSDRSVIQLLHTPATNVTRVFNVNTGERYIVLDQNLDSTTNFNESGRVKISGNTLPTGNDILQVDYTWVISYDSNLDYDGLTNTNNYRSVVDSIDWGYSSQIKESILFTKTNDTFIGTSSHPVQTLNAIKKYSQVDGSVTKITSGIFNGRLSVSLSNLSEEVATIYSIKLKNTNQEVFNTSQSNGAKVNNTSIYGITLFYGSLIILPVDTTANENDSVTVFYNEVDVIGTDVLQASSSINKITIPVETVNAASTQILLDVFYIANITELYSSATTSLPAYRVQNNYFNDSNSLFINTNIVNNLFREHKTIAKNLSNQLYVELSISSLDFTIDKIVSIIRLSDSLELWNANNEGSIVVTNAQKYQLIFPSFNLPAENDKVLVLYTTKSIKRFQPISFENSIIKHQIDSLKLDNATGNFYVPLNNFQAEVDQLSFELIDPNTNTVYSSFDGYLIIGGDTATIQPNISLAAVNYILNKKIKIISSNSLNNGVFDIKSYSNLNTIEVYIDYGNIKNEQVSVINISDGKELWSSSGVISENKLILPSNNTIGLNTKVFVNTFNYKVARNSPTKLALNTSDQVNNTGVITISGNTFYKAEDIVFTVTNTGLKHSLTEAIRKQLKINSTASIPSNIKVVSIIKADNVNTISANSNEVLSVNNTYDVKFSELKNTIYYPDMMIYNGALSNYDFVFPATTTNVSNTPQIGDKIRISFYYILENDSESLSFSRNGLLYSNKKFVVINKVYVSSGFNNSQSCRLAINSFNQPNLGSRYKVFYNYIAPKQNERIVIKYNYNKIISDVTFTIEGARPINADVLVKEAKNVLLDLTINVVIADQYKTSQTNVLQTLKDQLIAALSTTKLNEIIDVPTIINVAQAVNGISRARVLYFNKAGNMGTVNSIQSQKDEFFSSNNVIINVETR